MSFPAPAAHGQGQVKESGGQPLVYGSIPPSTILYRNSGITIVGLTLGTNLTVVGTTLNAASGSGVSDGDYGDVVVSGGGTIWTVDTSTVMVVGGAAGGDLGATYPNPTVLEVKNAQDFVSLQDDFNKLLLWVANTFGEIPLDLENRFEQAVNAA